MADEAKIHPQECTGESGSGSLVISVISPKSSRKNPGGFSVFSIATVDLSDDTDKRTTSRSEE